jgi:hypothetical protein
VKHNTGEFGPDQVNLNTIQRMSQAATFTGINGEITDHVIFAYNLFKNCGWLFVLEDAAFTGGNVLWDNNMYWPGDIGPVHYYNDDNNHDNVTHDTVAAIRGNTRHEDHGVEYDPAAVGSYGCRDLEVPQEWQSLPLSFRGASSNMSSGANTLTWNYQRSWRAASSSGEWLAYALNGSQTFQHFVAVVSGARSDWRPRNYRVEVSEDANSWDMVYEGVNNNDGNWIIGTLDAPATARYVRFFIRDTHGGNARLTDFQVGNLV